MIKKKQRNIAFNFIFAALTLITAIIFYKSIWVTTGILFIITILGLLYWRTKKDLILFLFGGFFGPLAEIICIHFGLWSYSLPNVFYIPIWLFFVWGNAVIFIYHFSKMFKEKK